MTKHLRMTDEEYAKLKGRVREDTGNRGPNSGPKGQSLAGVKTGIGHPAAVSKRALQAECNSAPSSFTFTFQGQLPSGKNSIKTTRTGKRYPTQRFVEWRDEAVAKATEHVRTTASWTHWPWFRKPTKLCIEIHYAAGDLRRRDIPGMLDALFHVLERAQVVEDDAQIKETHWYQLPVDRSAPGVTVTLREAGKP